MPYRWEHPHEWLDEKIDSIRDGKFAELDLAAFCRSLASKLDSDDIQDLFQDEMDADGYFTETTE